ncbi:hypothetical protein D3C86_1716580 [compost metagenome]
MGQPMGERDIPGREDLHLFELEDAGIGALRHTELPVGAIALLALELQGLDRIESDDVVGIRLHDGIDVLGHHGTVPALDQLANLGFSRIGGNVRIHGSSPSWYRMTIQAKSLIVV